MAMGVEVVICEGVGDESPSGAMIPPPIATITKPPMTQPIATTARIPTIRGVRLLRSSLGALGNRFPQSPQKTSSLLTSALQ